MPVQYDLVITGDRIIDPANGLNGAAQVAVKDGKIAAVAERLPPHNVEKSVDAIGKIVCPGLIDMHVHVYEWVTNFGLPADDAGIHSGATTIGTTTENRIVAPRIKINQSTAGSDVSGM